MKKHVVLFLVVCVMLPCLSGCNMTKKQISEYSAFDYNVIWEKGEKVIRPQRFLGKLEYYSIEGVSKKEFIACKKHHQEIGGFYEEPVVLMHQDKGGAYSLNVSTAQLTLRDMWWREQDREYWLHLGENSRKQVLLSIDENIANRVADDLSAEYRNYLSKQQLEAYDQSSPDYLFYKSTKVCGYLWIEFRLEGYDNLIWAGEIMKIDDDYVIAIHKPGGGASYNYLRCDEAFSELLKQVEEEYALSSRS